MHLEDTAGRCTCCGEPATERDDTGACPLCRTRLAGYEDLERDRAVRDFDRALADVLEVVPEDAVCGRVAAACGPNVVATMDDLIATDDHEGTA